MVLTDWAADGRFLTFYSGGVVLVAPLSANQTGLERKAMEWLRDESSVAYGLFSPDSRLMAYVSNEVNEVYVRPFDARKPDAGTGGADPVRVSTAGARAMIYWRPDGKEIYYLTPDWEVMAVDVITNPAFKTGMPRLLFKLPGPLPGNPQLWKNVSGDGQRFVFTINVPVSVSAR